MQPLLLPTLRILLEGKRLEGWGGFIISSLLVLTFTTSRICWSNLKFSHPFFNQNLWCVTHIDFLQSERESSTQVFTDGQRKTLVLLWNWRCKFDSGHVWVVVEWRASDQIVLFGFRHIVFSIAINNSVDYQNIIKLLETISIEIISR